MFNVPKLRFGEFEGEWVEKKLGDISKTIGGGTPDSKKKEYWNGSIPWISSSDIKENNIQEIEITRFITEDAINNSATKLIPKNSILIVSRVGVGKFAVTKKELCTSQDFTNLITKENAYFLAYYFSSRSNYFIRLSQGTSIKGFTGKDIKSSKFLIPSFLEQQKIANFLTSIDQKIEQLKQKRNLLESYKKGVMQKIFSEEIRFFPTLVPTLSVGTSSGFDDWEEKRLGDIATFFSGGTPTSTNKSYYIGTIPFIGSGNIKSEKVEQFISEEALKKSSSKIVDVGDLLYALYGATSGEVAISQINGAINQAVLCIRSSENIAFLYYWLILQKGKILATYLQGGQGNLSAKIIKNLKLNLPSLEEQQKIATFLTSIDQKITQNNQALEQMKAFKKGLLQQMFV